MSKRMGGLALLATAAWWGTSWPARADVWDLAANQDDSSATQNVLGHGGEQLHDLAAQGDPDQDWYVFLSGKRSSYEVVVDNTTGDAALNGPDIARLALNGNTVLQVSDAPAGISGLRWMNSGDADEVNFIRVTGAACGTTCLQDDQYRIRFRETTGTFARFNNTGTQLTVLHMASVVPFPCGALLHFYDAFGTLLGTETRGFTGNREMAPVNTATTPAAAGKSGWIVVAHTCGYGGLTGKAVTLEPATGFAFDTPLVYRAY